MINYSLSDTIKFIVNSVPNEKPADLANKCRQLGMIEQEFIDYNIFNTLPSFDGGYVFLYKTDDSVQARLEIDEKNEIILQAGIQILYPKTFFPSKIRKHFKHMASFLKLIYGLAEPMEIKNVNINNNIFNFKYLNYGNADSVCYLSKSKTNGQDVLTFKVGNRAYF